MRTAWFLLRFKKIPDALKKSGVRVKLESLVQNTVQIFGNLRSSGFVPFRNEFVEVFDRADPAVGRAHV